MRAIKDTLGGLPSQFWWLWASTLINRLGGFVTTFLALYLTVDQGLSASFAGLVAALYGIGGAVAAVVAGVLADRLGRRPTLLVSQLATAAAMAILGFSRQPALIAVVVTVLGVTANAARPCIQAIIADLVPDKDRVRAFSLNYWAVNIGFGVASAAAGLIAEHGYLLLFLGNSASVLLCAIVIFLKVPETKPQDHPSADQTPSADHDAAVERTTDDEPGSPAPGLGAVLRDGRFMVVVFLAFLVAMVLMQYTTSLPVSMGKEGFSSADYGFVISMNGLVVVLAQIPVTRLLKDTKPVTVLVIASLLVGFGFGLTALVNSVPLYIMTVCIWTIGEIMHNPTSMALAAGLSPAHIRGRYQGIYTLSWAGATFAGPLLGGIVIDRFGSDTLWAGCAVVGVIAAVGYGALAKPLGQVIAPAAPTRQQEREPELKGEG
ncbi:MDR family MFS transporter [Streptomyces tailanensis]|uniref:MDR family MFS transporter n=1 Tax=Streptomyces tailanensis TaxID=2569858 RepID=UPI001FE9CB9C|nr:MFS transporter [Streptomyces tailanensis]